MSTGDLNQIIFGCAALALVLILAVNVAMLDTLKDIKEHLRKLRERQG